MKMNLRLLSIFAAFLALTGCAWNAFAPPPDEWSLWKKTGTEPVTVWKDMLECGYSEPYIYSKISREDFTLEGFVASMRCMESLGYGRKEGRRVVEVCKMAQWRRNASCQPDAVVPVADARRRLEGRFCAKYPKDKLCQ